MNVLSLFDGMSCGQIALQNLGFAVEKYFASEINRNAIAVTMHNFPDTIQIGDIKNVAYTHSDCLYWQPLNWGGTYHASEYSWNGKIDLVMGGSPCQGFSVASGDRKNFDDPRSRLFYEFVRVLDEVKPKWFLLENVPMKQEWVDRISFEMGRDPVIINSCQFVPQLRKRLYWTNIPILRRCHTEQYLSNILTSGYTDRQYARCLLESESRPNTDKRRLFRRYKRTGFGTIVFEREDLCPLYIRSFNQTELERLQGVPEGYTSILPRNQAASLLGNGWTVPVIEHIFKGLMTREAVFRNLQLNLWGCHSEKNNV